MRASARGSRGADHLPDGPEENANVEPNGPILDVEEIQPDAIAHLDGLSSFAPPASALGKAGDAGFGQVPEPVGCAFRRQDFVQWKRMRTRSHEAHLPP